LHTTDHVEYADADFGTSRTASTMSRASVLTMLPAFEGVTEDEQLHELPRPSDLPEEWAQMITKSGRVFYVK
jgi:hypothetical protein